MEIEHMIEPLVTISEATKALKVLQSYVARNLANSELVLMYGKIDDELSRQRLLRLKQKNFTDYFNFNQ